MEQIKSAVQSTVSRMRTAAAADKPSAPRAWPLPVDWPEGTDPAFAEFDTSLHPALAEALAATWDWTEAAYHGEARGLVLWGTNYGSGKTHLAHAAHATLARWGKFGEYWSSPVWFLRIKSFYNDDSHDDEFRTFLGWKERNFILDDLGKERVKPESLPWAQEKLFLLVDGLAQTGKSLLITSNLAPEQMAERVGGATWSRIYGLCGKNGFVNLSEVPDHRMRRS